jgi:hypothetical protein
MRLSSAKSLWIDCQSVANYRAITVLLPPAVDLIADPLPTLPTRY